jgi:uncharacterized membrane protein YgcG
MLKKVIGSLALPLALAACSPQDAHHPLAHVQHHNMVAHEYREHGSDSNDWIYWYVLYSSSTGPTSTTSSSATTSSTPQYYYRSTSPVTNFSTTQFTRVNGGALPKDVKEEVDKSEETGEHEMAANEEPADVAQTEAQEASAEAAAESAADAAVTAAGGSGSREQESESNQNESQSESTSSESSSGGDSGSSGGDSGGGDGGGGGE